MAFSYSEKVKDHYQNPRNVGEIKNASGVGTVGNAKCGDIMRIYLDIDDDTKIIKDCKFKTFGCGAAVDGLPPVKVHCSLLAEEAIHAALWDYAEKHNIKIEGLEKPVNDIEEKETDL